MHLDNDQRSMHSYICNKTTNSEVLLNSTNDNTHTEALETADISQLTTAIATLTEAVELLPAQADLAPTGRDARSPESRRNGEWPEHSERPRGRGQQRRHRRDDEEYTRGYGRGRGRGGRRCGEDARHRGRGGRPGSERGHSEWDRNGWGPAGWEGRGRERPGRRGDCCERHHRGGCGRGHAQRGKGREPEYREDNRRGNSGRCCRNRYHDRYEHGFEGRRHRCRDW